MTTVIKAIISKTGKCLVKLLHDIVLTMYDDLEFKALSLPRLAFFFINNGHDGILDR